MSHSKWSRDIRASGHPDNIYDLLSGKGLKERSHLIASDQSGWGNFTCFTDGTEDDVINDSSIIEINNDKMIHHIVWEFQRYQPSTGWGAGKNLLPTDPGRWANHKRDKFKDSLEDIAPPIPHGYCVDLGWAIVVQKRKYKPNTKITKLSITDRFGWHYSSSFEATSWSDVYQNGYNVRRRAWRRVLIPINSYYP